MRILSLFAFLALASCATSSSPAPKPAPAPEPAKPAPAKPEKPAARAVELIPRDVLFGNPERQSPQISPDGTKLAWLAPQNGVLNVWIRTLGKTDDRCVTNDTKRGI